MDWLICFWGTLGKARGNELLVILQVQTALEQIAFPHLRALNGLCQPTLPHPYKVLSRGPNCSWLSSDIHLWPNTNSTDDLKLKVLCINDKSDYKSGDALCWILSLLWDKR